MRNSSCGERGSIVPAMSTEQIAKDCDGWPIFVGTLVRFERAGATVRAWVERGVDDMLSVTDEKRGIARSVRAVECTVCKPTQSQKMRRGANGQQIEAANALARKGRKGVR
jgi:hypothetical protein